MLRQMNMKQYRAMDVCVFTTLMCVCEALIVLSATHWFPQELYTLSIVPAVSAIVLVRWGLAAAVPALAGGLVFCLLSGATRMQLLIYCAGNLLLLPLALPMQRGGWKRLQGSALFALCYGASAALLMQAGRGAAALLMGASPAVCVGFFATDVLSSFFSALVMLICRRLDGMLEEQRHYLLRIQKEMKENQPDENGI